MSKAIATCLIGGLTCLLLSHCGVSTHTLIQRAQQGDTAAQYEYGRRLLTGQHTERNPHIAHQWFRVAAHGGHAKAQAALGACYQRGLGGPRHEQKAIQWYALAALQDEPHALHALLEHAARQPGHAEAERILQPLLQGQHPAAELYMGTRLLMNDACSPAERRQAVDYIRYAALSGSGEAAFLMFLCYTEGSGVHPSPRLALGWLTLAAEREYEPALQLIMEWQQLLHETC